MPHLCISGEEGDEVSRRMARFLSEAGAHAQRWAWEQGVGSRRVCGNEPEEG